MAFVDAHSRTVPSHIALDASGRVKPGYREVGSVVQDGERISFDLAFRDAKPTGSTVFLMDEPKPFVSPSQARQAQIAAEVAGNAVARQTANDKHVSDAIAAVTADRAAGNVPASLSAIRDARYVGPNAVSSEAAPVISVADNSHVASALRTARYL